MQENSPQLRDLAKEPLGDKSLTFYMEIGVRSAIAGSNEEFCLFSAESGESHSKVISFSNLANITELGPGHWALSVREGQSVSSVSLTAANSEFARKLKFAMEQLAIHKKKACPTSAPLKILVAAQPDKPNETAAAILIVVMLLVFFGVASLGWQRATTGLFLIAMFFVGCSTLYVFLPGATRKNALSLFGLTGLAIGACLIVLLLSLIGGTPSNNF